VVSANYFTFATQDKTNTIFAAPDAADGAGTWSNGDVALTDAILTQIEGDLCVDKTRVFATGFSFGGGMAMALAAPGRTCSGPSRSSRARISPIPARRR